MVNQQALDVLLTRRSVRKFKPDAVPTELLDKILEAGTFAPTSMGMQKPIIIAVTDKKMRDEISRQNAKIIGDESKDPFYGAPVILVVAVEKSPNAVYDGSCVMSNLLNAAHACGLGSCWIHRAKEEFESELGKDLLKKIGVKGEYVGVGHVALGYVDGEYPVPKPRKNGWIYKI